MTQFDKAAEAINIVRQLRDGRFNDDELDTILNRLAELYGRHDINLLHIPEDAGTYRAGIVELLSRIPDGWGRWISCEAGWYRLITELNDELAEIDPNYVVHQIKQKFGTLRFYADTDAEGEHLQRFEARIADAEARSSKICERCSSSPAELCLSGAAPFSHSKTLCRTCRTPS